MKRGSASLNSLEVFILCFICMTTAILVTSCGGGGSTAAVNSAAATASPSLSPLVVNIAGLPVGSTSSPQTVTLTNPGSAALSVSSLAISGTDATDFAQSNNCGDSVAAGGKCTISVTFRPVAMGSRTASLVLNNAGSSGGAVQINGVGMASAVSLSSTSLSFVGQAVGVLTPSQTVTVTNSGNDVLNVSSIQLIGADAGDFTQNNNCGSSVPAGASCTITASFKASAAGGRTATLSLNDNAPDAPQSVVLFGTIATTSASVSPSPWRLVASLWERQAQSNPSL